MQSAFAPVRFFCGTRLHKLNCPARAALVQRKYCNTQASLSARDRRRATEIARSNAHRDVKRELDEKGNLLWRAFVSVPGSIRERCSLTNRTARVKLFFEKRDVADLHCFREQLRSKLVLLFPELQHRGLLGPSDGFDLKVGGLGLLKDSSALQRQVQACAESQSALYVEIIPHNIPPAKPPLSERLSIVTRKAKTMATDPEQKLLMVSFYKFIRIDEPAEVSNALQKVWKRMGIKGRTYVATEGINAQLAVPEVTYNDFKEALEGSWCERGAPIIPQEIIGVFVNVDRTVLQRDEPFQKLHVRHREKILSDGLQESLNWYQSGEKIPPEQWHRAVQDKDPNTVLLDCRNHYESSVGRFEGAEVLNTHTFRDIWAELEKRLRNEDRTTRILTYCTGGIRCVKVNAYLEQKMGFQNTARLDGGIVAYTQKLRENGQLHGSTFKGVNHVFDGRMGEVITNDLLDRCVNCGDPCNAQTDCANDCCPRPFNVRMFVQCEECTARLKGACSTECYEIVTDQKCGLETLSRLSPDFEKERYFLECDKTRNETYADAFSSQETSLLAALRRRTQVTFPNRFQIMSSHVQASLLQMIVKMNACTRVLEIGTFTGYSSLAMATALPHFGRLITCERDSKAAAIAEEFFAKDTAHGPKIRIEIGDAAEYIRQLAKNGCECFDLVFVDADKGGYETYTRDILNHNLLKKGGVLIFDNVLFRGEVSKIWERNLTKVANGHAAEPKGTARNLQNMEKTAQKLHRFNAYLKNERRLQQVVLPFRDGLTIAIRTDND